MEVCPVVQMLTPHFSFVIIIRFLLRMMMMMMVMLKLLLYYFKVVYKPRTTLNNGYLGSRIDEERSEMRYVV